MSSIINTSFSKLNPRLQISWDSVSRGAWKFCKRYYKYTIIDGYVTKEDNVHFIFGIGFHSAIELYHREKVKTKNHKTSMISAVRYTLEYTWDFKRNRPWISDISSKTRATLIRTVIWYLDQFQDDPYEIIIQENGQPAVELSFHYETNIITKLTNEPITLCGHLDRMVSKDDELFIPDVKTTKKTLGKNAQEFFDNYSPDDQMSGYYFAGMVAFHKPIRGIIIDAAQTAVTFSRFQRGFTYRTQDQLNEWYNDLSYMINVEVEYSALHNHYPQNEKSCGSYGGCPFRIVCGETPKLRQEILDKLFMRRIWDPMISREI